MPCQNLILFQSENSFRKEMKMNMNKLNVIYEDNHIIVVEKQPNIPSQADKTEDIDMLTIIKEYIKENIINQEMFT